MSREKTLINSNSIDMEMYIKSRDEINQMCDSGMFKPIIVGYSLLALEHLSGGMALPFTEDEICHAFNVVFESHDAECARNRF